MRRPTARRRRPADYTARSGTLDVRGRGRRRRPSPCTVNGDTLDEANETFFVNLSAPSNATIADGQGVGTITDDDATPSLSINDVTVTEGNAGTTTPRSRSRCPPRAARPSPSTTRRPTATATAPARLHGDHRHADLRARARPRRPITSRCNGDTARRGERDVLRQPLEPVNATIADGQGLGTIIDDDPPPALSSTTYRWPKATPARANATFTVSLARRPAA